MSYVEKLIGPAIFLEEIASFMKPLKNKMTEVKGVGRRRTQLLDDDLRNSRRYWELKEEAEDRNRCKPQFNNRT